MAWPAWSPFTSMTIDRRAASSHTASVAETTNGSKPKSFVYQAHAVS